MEERPGRKKMERVPHNRKGPAFRRPTRASPAAAITKQSGWDSPVCGAPFSSTILLWSAILLPKMKPIIGSFIRNVELSRRNHEQDQDLYSTRNADHAAWFGGGPGSSGGAVNRHDSRKADRHERQC